MGIILYKEPRLQNPDLIASWPGIGNIGLIAVDTLRGQIRAEELGMIEPWDFFYPSKVTIKDGVIADLAFPASKFSYKRLGNRDLLFFIGEEQPADESRIYAEGMKAYQMANMVLDTAEKFGCRRVYTSGAAVALTHHTLKPRVWAVSSQEELLSEIKKHKNTILMGDAIGRGERGTITGLNGLLLGLAKKRGLEAVCLMGEIPDYLSGAPFPYPRASKAILEVLANILEIEIDYSALDEMAAQVDGIISNIYGKLPSAVKERIDQRKYITQGSTETITEEDENWLKEHIDEFFKKGGTGDEQPS